MLIQFTVDRWLDTEDRTKRPKFKKGSTHDLSEAAAYRWVRRNVAVYVVEEPAPARPKLKINRPMMGGAKKFRDEMAKVDLVGLGKMAAEIDKPQKRGRKPKGV